MIRFAQVSFRHSIDPIIAPVFPITRVILPEEKKNTPTTTEHLVSLLYGMQNASHDSTSRKFLGKNIFTNAFPLSLANYIHLERGLDIPVVSATVGAGGEIETEHVPTPWPVIINADPATARWQFEGDLF